MKNVVKKKISKKLIPEYVLEIISMNYDKCFLDLTAIENGDELTLVHDVTGYSLIKEGQITLYKALEVIKNVILYEEINENHLIFPEEYLINIDTIYINKDKGDVLTKIMYSPDEEGKSFHSKLYELISDLANFFEYSDKALLLSVLENFNENEADMRELTKELDGLCENVLI